ncbi:MAG: methyltransferase [Lachnospiraceae bacterium]|jgi:uroporphyrinogen decarboxylase|nr:methyltransferase [Lachnospiraceae bacterium]
MNLRKHLNLATDKVRLYDICQQLAYIDEDIVDYLGGDFMLAHRMRLRYGISCKEWREDTLSSGGKCWVPSELDPEIDAAGNKNIYVNGHLEARMPKNGLYYDQMGHVLEDVEEIEELDGYIAERFEQDEIDYIAEEVNHLYNHTDKAIVFGFGGSIFEQGQIDFNFENFYANLLLEPELMHTYFSKLTDAYLYNLKSVLDLAGDKIDVIHFRDDLGTQIAPQISVETYCNMIKPYHSKMFQFVHENYPNVKCMLHSCGAIFDLLPEIIDAGADLINPQINITGMEPEKLKAAYGDKLMFWGGGADMQIFALNHSLDELREHVEQNIRAFSKNGGYVFTQVHNLQANVSPETVLAIYETAKKYKDALG